jgi:hypothetical protein
MSGFLLLSLGALTPVVAWGPCVETGASVPSYSSGLAAA